MTTTLTELPAPIGPAEEAAAHAWSGFIAYALSQAAPAKGNAAQSALLVENPSLTEPRRRACSASVPAVVIDLDEGQTAFEPSHLTAPPAALTAQLVSLRQAGIVVLWISKLPAARAADVAQALQKSGLDPKGEDQLLLVRNGDDRKQALRIDAEADVCIVAIAGDRNGDFDELYDYLRDPDGALGLSSMFDHGWFLVPTLTATTKAGG